MFVFSVKASRKRLLTVLTALAATVGVLLMLCLPAAQSTGGRAVDLKVSDTGERVRLLGELGHTVDAGSETVREIRLPDEPDATLSSYEQLQAAAGMSLLKYCGKRVKLYTYTVTNAPDEDSVLVHLYCYRDRVIAGDVTSADPGGTQAPLIA